MSKTNFELVNERIAEINNMSEEVLYELLLVGNCPYPCEMMTDVPLGMHHCPICGTMVVSGFPHGPIDPPFMENDVVVKIGGGRPRQYVDWNNGELSGDYYGEEVDEG